MSLEIIKNYDYTALLFLGGMCKIIEQLYPKVDTYLKRFERYNELPLGKRNYIIKNFIKSFLLLALSMSVFKPVIWPAIRYNQWNSKLIHLTGAMYTSNDLMGLVMVESLPYSTKMHHAISTTLCITCFSLDFQTSHLGKMMFVYTFASSQAYLVNFYLGARLLTDKAKLEIVRIASRNIYFICCLFNWGWHLLWVSNNYSIMNTGHIMYFFLLFWIIKDDIILLSWLNNTMIKFS
uniref:TLC domain-containing protein n=1 Tax=viral metagenome TaxID=1070528 RepID=A0A6C0C3T5_9ZZZZ